MVERYDLPRVPSHTRPSFWNYETAKWGLIAGIAAWAVAGMLGGLPIFAAQGALVSVAKFLPLLTLGGGYLGANYGARLGMEEQAREQMEGRVVSDPTYLNKGALPGLAAGLVLSLAGLPGLGLGMLAAAGGSYLRKNQMEKEFNLATAQDEYNHARAGNQAAVAQGYTLAPVMAPVVTTYKDSVSPDEAQTLAARQEARSQQQFHTGQLEAEAALTTETQR